MYHPTIYQPAPLIEFIDFITQLSTQATLIICTTRQSFLLQLQESIINHCQPAQLNSSVPDYEPISHLTNPLDHPLLARTLRLLAISTTIKVIFCPSVAAYHAKIATLYINKTGEATDDLPILAILNVVTMHSMTASFSAQGLGKAFAATVEAAWRTKHRLALFEYPEGTENIGATTLNDNSVPVDEPDVSDAEAENENPNAMPARRLTVEDPWQEEVQILNATTKTFGNVGNRGWMGQTVKVCDIAARWFMFSQLPGRMRGNEKREHGC